MSVHDIAILLWELEAMPFSITEESRTIRFYVSPRVFDEVRCAIESRFPFPEEDIIHERKGFLCFGWRFLYVA